MKKVFLIAIGIILGIVMSLGYNYLSINNSYFEVSEDCVIGGEVGILKKGTIIKYDESYSEGFDRFILHLNIKDLKLKERLDLQKDNANPYWLEAKTK